MKYTQLYLAMLLMFALMFFSVRLIIRAVIDYRVKKSSRRRKGQSFLDWLFYRRFRDVMTKPFWIMYYGCFIFFSLALITLVIMDCLNIPYDTARNFFRYIWYCCGLFCTIFWLLIKGKKTPNRFNMDWVSKKVPKNLNKKYKKKDDNK